MNQHTNPSGWIRRLAGFCVTGLFLTHGALAGSPLAAHGGGVAASPQHEHPPHAARAGFGDADLDGIQDYADNCSQVANADQRDTDADGFGNLCDADLSNDGSVNFIDLALMKAVFFSGDANADLNGDGQVNFLDLGIMKANFFAAPGPSGMPCAGTAPCPAPLLFDWPMPGSDGSDWVINNYVDIDPGAGLRDYTGGTKTYNGSNGVDIDVPTFRSMDNNLPILAAAQGVVIDLADGNPDRNVFCAGDWNFVTVGHPNGWTTTYGHLKKASVVVAVGDVVNPGDQLGVVGSSGCSTAPHLHFEVRDEQGNVVSPFANGMWNAPPVYDTPISVMDITVQDEGMSEIVEIMDPPPDVSIVPPGHTFGIGLSVAGGQAGDTLRWRIADSANATVNDFEFAFTTDYRHSFWYLNFFLPSNLPAGNYMVEVYANSVLAQSHALQIAPFPADWQQVHHALPAASYQQVFNAAVAAGYRLTWIDGYEVNGATFFNAIFDKSPSGLWLASHNLDGTQFQSLFNTQIADGYRVAHIDSYLQGGQVRYAVIFVRQFAQLFAAYHGSTVAQHQTSFSDLTAAGWIATHISFVEFGGAQFVTALYTSKPVGAWVALANLNSAAYQEQFDANTNAGRTLRYLNAYTLNGQPAFSAIWQGNNPLGWAARHDLSDAQYQAEAATWAAAGLRTRLVTGYDNGAGVARFGAFWAN